MKKYLTYLAIISVIFLGASAFAEENETNEGKQESKMDLKERALEMRTRMEDRLKERGEKIKDDSRESKTIDIVCAQTAVEARDTAIISAFDTYSIAMKTALEARKVAVKDAWSKTTPSERSTARRTANQTYNTASKTAHKALNTSRKSIWNTHKADMKKCGAGAGIDQMGEISGGLSL